MILVIGEILFDLFGNNKKLGGAPFNFAFHLKKLGFPVRFVSRVGKDALGREILYFLKQHQFDLTDIQTDPDHDTGTVKVTMSHEGHAFTITPDTAWAHLAFDRGLSTLLRQSCDLLYFGSLIQHSKKGTDLIQTVMSQKQSGTTVFCDLNLRPGFYGPAVIKAALGASDILKLSREEWRKISDIRISETLNREIMGLAGEFAGHICGIKGALPEDDRIYNDLRQRIQKR